MPRHARPRAGVPHAQRPAAAAADRNSGREPPRDRARTRRTRGPKLSEPMIRAQNLRKRFGQIAAVDDVSLSAEDGRITGLLGPNGAGKTTTLRLLYGLMKPDSGSVQID